jgi:DNA primase
MDALSHVLQSVDYEKLLEHYKFNNIKISNHYIRSSCKIHGGNNPSAFVVNLNNGLWYCHTGDCGGGDAVSLVEHMENLSFVDSIRWLANFFSVDIAQMEIKARSTKYYKELKTFIEIVKSSRKRNNPKREFELPSHSVDVSKFRTFHESTIEKFGLKFLDYIKLLNREDKEFTFRNRLIIPIKSKENINIAYALRKTRANDQPKWFYQPNDFEAGEILYNYAECVGAGVVAVVEGIFDVWAYHEIGVKAVATLGAHLTGEQARLLLTLGCDVVLSYDGDDAGRKATNKAIDVLHNKANISIVPFADGEDPESITRKELYDAFTNRKRIRG